jgi:hypothetical protein
MPDTPTTDEPAAYIAKHITSMLDSVAMEAKVSPMTDTERRHYNGLQQHFIDSVLHDSPDDQPEVTIALFHTCLSYLARLDVPYYRARLEHFVALCSHLPK